MAAANSRRTSRCRFRIDGYWNGDCRRFWAPQACSSIRDCNYTIGYQLGDPHWGQGRGTRACEFVVWHGFVQLGASRLSGETSGSNIASARVMEKCGFQREGVRRGYYSAHQHVHDDVLFGLMQEDHSADVRRKTSRFRPMR